VQGSSVPHLLLEVSDAVEVAASSYHTCALTRGGDVYCWGYNESGELGVENAPQGTCPTNVLDRPGDYPCQPVPTRVAAVSGARHIAVADGRSCAVLADASVTCWGDVANISTWVAGAVAPGGGGGGACWGLPAPVPSLPKAR
jgi:alpha-tubulin suppressor-like RCC1 family protein